MTQGTNIINMYFSYGTKMRIEIKVRLTQSQLVERDESGLEEQSFVSIHLLGT